jgi:hypothetical protein
VGICVFEWGLCFACICVFEQDLLYVSRVYGCSTSPKMKPRTETP